MGSKSSNYNDDDISNGESSKNDASVVNVNDTQSEIDEHDGSNYSDNENDNSLKKDSSCKKSRNNDSSKKSPLKESKSRSKADQSKTRYLWVSGIPDGTKTSQLEELFLQHGKVLAIKIIRGGTDSTLLGFVKMETVEQAQKCLEKLDRIEFRGNKLELLKERPVDKEAKKPEKISFRDNRKPFVSRPVVSRPQFRSSNSSSRGSYRTPIKPLHTQHREHSRVTPDFRRQEREEYLRLEREKERLKMERIKLERDKAELLKIEREPRVYEREIKLHDDKRVRSLIKRPIEEPFIEEKRSYEDFNRREDFSRRYDSRSSPERKISSSRPFTTSSVPSRARYEDNTRLDRYSDKYEQSNKTWSSINDNSWASNENHRWQSASTYDSPRIISSGISSNTLPRLHSSAEIPPSISSRSYFSSGRRY